MKNLKLYEQALLESLTRVPYNSAAQFPNFIENQSTDPKLGVACVLQSLDAAERAERSGAPEAVFLQDGRHIAAVFEYDDGIVILDPYLLHTKPIVLNFGNAVHEPETVTVPALPKRLDSKGVEVTSQVTATLFKGSGKDGYKFSLDYYRYSPTKASFFLSRHFKLDSQNRIDRNSKASNVVAILTHPEQTSLSIRVVSGETFYLSEVILPLSDWADTEVVAENLFIRNNNGEVFSADSDFATEAWDLLTQVTEHSQKEIEQHLEYAFSIYKSIADPAIEIKAYNLQSE